METTSPTFVAFGSLTPWPTSTELTKLRHALLQHQELQPLCEAINGLPKLWNVMCHHHMSLKRVDGILAAEQLNQWLLTGQAPTRGFAMNNILSLPFTIVSHICDYFHYFHENHEHDTRHIKVEGFCAGLLSAVAVRAAGNHSQVGRHGALSILLAFAIGACVDMDALQHGQTTCLAVRCKPPTTLDIVREGLKDYDSAYISVIRNSNEATITVPSFCAAQISRNLSADGVTIMDTGLSGRYHCSSHSVAARIISSSVEELGYMMSDEFARAVHDILMDVSDWSVQLEAANLSQNDIVLTIGDAVKSSMPRNIKTVSTEERKKSSNENLLADYPANAIAVVGMSCKLPGADSVEEFWQLLTSGKSMVESVPEDRWPEFASNRGKSKTKKYWGNFLKDIDAFDHRFFKKSAREAATMDPQQRLLLQAAYEALESSGYFTPSPNSPSSSSKARDIGCYIGLCAVDYEVNTTCHAPNAFTSLGTLRAFLSGKLSHFFGWSGPSLTFDTACSSSAVAIHTACRALQAGECSQAMAGGVALFTSPHLYENLTAAHFLSPTGATKPFDSRADGYCRGEGLGLVMLKKLSNAVADGDEVLAVIGGSAINQNDSCVPITVPHATSQQNLYQNAAKQAGIKPQQVSFVEAHGTGTPVGDPIEMDSIRNMFGGPTRRNQLVVSSVKGSIGHLEGASGVAGLIKAILQIQHRTAVVQASFQSLNPKIPALEPDNIVIPTANIPLTDSFITACVNNYGASGSNSTLMVMQAPKANKHAVPPLAKYPIAIAANSEAAVQEYCRALQDYTIKSPQQMEQIASVAYRLSRRHNQKLPYLITATASNMQTAFTQPVVQRRSPANSLVLAFGGQVRDSVGLRKEIWDQFAILRLHIDRCDDVLRSMGHASLYPAIFQIDPIEDLVTLHSAVFALQYASAKAWIDCGLKVDCVIGHSLGQLTALTVSGALSLQDGLKFVAGRASLMKKYWGPEPGSMILVDADTETTSALSHSLETACYNGPASQVLVGEEAAVDDFEQVLTKNSIRFKRLQVTNGFHSKFTEPLIGPLTKLASSLRFNKPTIPIETCSQGGSWPQVTPDLLAQHTREPVYFSEAVQRIASRGTCTWLEVGSDAGITGMARRALTAPDHEYLSTTLSKSSALETIVDNTTTLWQYGHITQFWAFHHLQAGQYEHIRLPPYQWEKNKHWLDLLPQQPESTSVSTAVVENEVPQLIKFVSQNSKEAVFRIGAQSDEYQRLVSGHAVAGSPLCPATVYMEVAARACKTLCSWDSTPHFGFSDLRIDSPLGMSESCEITMVLHSISKDSWEFNVLSSAASSKSVSHATGKIHVEHDAAAVQRDMSRYARLIRPGMIQALLDDPSSECVRGSMLYKLFSRVVNYSGPYQGLKSVAAKDGCIAGVVTADVDNTAGNVLFQPPTIDSWMQIAGFHCNNFHPSSEDDVYVFTSVDSMQFGPDFNQSETNSWKIYSNLTPIENNEISNDIFVFDSVSDKLVVLILGARFKKVKLNSLAKVLSRLNGAATAPKPEIVPKSIETQLVLPPPPPPPETIPMMACDTRESIFQGICTVLELVAEIPLGDITGTASVEDLGIDSLMMMEVVSELSSYFSIHLPIEDMEGLSNVDSLINYLLKRGCGQDSAGPSTIYSGNSSVSPGTPSTSTVSSTDEQTDRQVEQLAKLIQGHLELDTTPAMQDNLTDLGLDSLLAIELGDDIEKMFSVTIDLHQIDETSSVADLVRLAGLNTEVNLTSIPPVRLDEPLVPASMVKDAPRATLSQPSIQKRAGVQYQTVTWKQIDGLELDADIYYPCEVDVHTTRPVAVLFHGGGHVLFTRKDIHIKHVKILLERGFLPISFDYRLCPEVTLSEGPMTDACDALQWAREQLSSVQLARPDIQMDTSRVVAAGWSAGGQLAMTLGYTAPARGLKAPDAVLAFYCPTNFEDSWWTKPILPGGVKEEPGTEYDLLEGVLDKPVTGYKPPTLPGAPMSLEDPRWRIIIHYNWKAQLVPVLVNGLPPKSRSGSRNVEELPMPPVEKIQAVSPFAQIVKGTYRTPTFIIHGELDDLIPWQQSRDTIEALKKQGVTAGLATPYAGHAFDLWGDETDWSSVMEGYDFLESHK